jgi:hypothetical protein
MEPCFGVESPQHLFHPLEAVNFRAEERLALLLVLPSSLRHLHHAGSEQGQMHFKGIDAQPAKRKQNSSLQHQA